MMRYAKTLAIVFSVALNLVFVGLRVNAWRAGEPGARSAPAKPLTPYLWKRLNLRPDQVKAFTATCRPFRQQLHEQGERIRTKRIALLDLLTKRPPDRAAIDRTMREIEVLQHQMQSKVIQHLLRESRIFTPAQRARFFSLLKARLRSSRLPRPSWMPRAHGKEAMDR